MPTNLQAPMSLFSLEETIKRVTNDNKIYVNYFAEDKSFNKILKIITKYSFAVYRTYGIHPHE